MPRFSDDWVIDKSMFQYMNGGQCACCSFAGFLPDGVPGMINSISDMETDAANAEIRALTSSPWPPEMREEVWGDRVRLRHKLKKEMPVYREFWVAHGEAFQKWVFTKPPKAIQKVLQLPRSEISERLQNNYSIGRHKGFGVVLQAVMEQVANFPLTKYPTDARGESEVQFEKNLAFDRRGGFTMKIWNASDGSRNEDILQKLMSRIQSLGGPKLLERDPSKKTEENEDANDTAQDDDDAQTGPSFRSDRRLVRLLVARYWADTLFQKFQAEQNESQLNSRDT